VEGIVTIFTYNFSTVLNLPVFSFGYYIQYEINYIALKLETFALLLNTGGLLSVASPAQIEWGQGSNCRGNRFAK
jgi:hypothetical protein